MVIDRVRQEASKEHICLDLHGKCPWERAQKGDSILENEFKCVIELVTGESIIIASKIFSVTEKAVSINCDCVKKCWTSPWKTQHTIEHTSYSNMQKLNMWLRMVTIQV